MENVLEEYLVKLGIQFDTNALKKAKGSIDDFKKKLEGMISKNVYATATTNFVGAIGSITIEITKMVNQVAKADMQYQLLAQRMFLSVQAAKAFTLTSETMGHSLQEIAWNVELRERYFDLVDQVNKLEIPQESRDMLKQVRGIGHEFDRLKLAGKLSLEWIAVHLLNLNKGGVGELKSSLRTFTETIFEKIPIWTKQLAEFLDVPIKLMGTVIKFAVVLKDTVVPPLEMIWGWFVKIWDIMKPAEKQFVILAGLLVAVFSPVLGPVAAATAAITGLLLLLDDFFGYMEGKKSSEFLAPFWEIVLFIGSHLKKALYGGIIMAEHFWAKLTGKEHYSGKSFLQDYTDVMKSIDAEFKEGQQKRFDAIAAHEVKAKGAAPAGAVSPMTGAVSGIVETGKGYNITKDVEGNLVKKEGTRAWRNNNPGNIEYGDFAKKMGAIGSDGRFAIFPNLETGRKAKEALIFERKGYRDRSLSAAISRYAPPNENDTRRYQRAILASVGGREKQMSQYTATERRSIVEAMEKVEGFRIGKTTVMSGTKGLPQNPPGSPVYAKTSASGEENYNVNVTINAQTTDPREIANEATKGVKRSIQELRKEKFDRVRAGKVALS